MTGRGISDRRGAMWDAARALSVPRTCAGRMNAKYLRKFRMAVLTLATFWALTFASAVQVLADQIEGHVSKVGEGGRVFIELPQGTSVAPGDPVRILAEIPGLGLTAISTLWQVESFADGVAVARPQDPPTGAPQVGYTARIEAAAAQPADSSASTGVNPAPMPGGETPPETASPEAVTLYLAARQLALSDNPFDHERAADLFRKAADLQHVGAMTALGALYGFGRGVDRNDATALAWHERASAYGDAEAMLRLGLSYLTGRGAPVDETAAANRLQQAAIRGNAQAMYILALLYEDGVGVNASLAETTKWLEQAARAGHVEAMYILGEIYKDGEDGIIARDIGKAESYWLMAAKAGHVGAMRQLGDFYEGKDSKASERWYQAARNAAPRPEYLSDPRCLSWWECYIPAPPAVDDPNTQTDAPPLPGGAGATRDDAIAPALRVTHEVQDCDRVAATPLDPDRPNPDLGIPYVQLDAQIVISECNADIKEWPDTARFYAQLARGYHKAGMYSDAFRAAMTGADLGSGQAMAIVGSMYQNGKYVSQDAPEALRWLEKAGFAGNVVAMHFAAAMHLHAQGVPYNAQAAAEWYQAAADHGSSEAMANLGILYDNGQGVPYDPEEASANLMAGLAMGSPKAQQVLLGNPNQLSPHTRIAVQRILQNDGLYSGALDGVFGPQTLRALRARIPD